ncbi:hypothetical protein EFS28_07455 [Lactobacillus acidophilus]|nr:hypothetical protein [Lactobacillus acidophilus]MCT3624043.1 hypothetical protein [Lactobacillus acidophilus]
MDQSTVVGILGGIFVYLIFLSVKVIRLEKDRSNVYDKLDRLKTRYNLLFDYFIEISQDYTSMRQFINLRKQTDDFMQRSCKEISSLKEQNDKQDRYNRDFVKTIRRVNRSKNGR